MEYKIINGNRVIKLYDVPVYKKEGNSIRKDRDIKIRYEVPYNMYQRMQKD